MRLRRAFGVINKDVARDPSLSTSAKALYLVLCTYADDDSVCWPGVDTLAANLGVAIPTAERALRELREHGIIERQRRRDSTAITRMTDAYTANEGSEPITDEGSEPVADEGKNKTSKNKTRESAPTRATPAPSTFPITDRMREWWASKNCPDVAPANETEKFLAYHRAKGSTFKDWYAAWQNWMLKAMEGPPGQARKPDSRYPSEEELLRRMR